MDLRTFAMGLSLGVSVLMLVGKLAAWWLTGSAAILSDALEAVIHLAATGVAAWSLAFSSQPADPDHPYGHGKAAYFSAGFEGALIGGAAIAILAVAGRALMEGPHLEALGAVTESSALKMHATTMAARPPFTYLAPASWSVIQAVWGWRAEGLAGYVTMDAGPNVKVLCSAADAPTLEARLAAMPEVQQVMVCAPGPAAALVEG